MWVRDGSIQERTQWQQPYAMVNILITPIRREVSALRKKHGEGLFAKTCLIDRSNGFVS